MEALQMLKFALRKLMDFTSGLLTPKETPLQSHLADLLAQLTPCHTDGEREDMMDRVIWVIADE